MVCSLRVKNMEYHISQTEDGVIRYPLHRHAFCEIMLYQQGIGYLRTDCGDIPFEEGTAIIVPANILHGSVSEQGFRNISIGGEFGSLLLLDRPVAIQTTADSRILGGLVYDNRYADESYVGALIQCYAASLMQTFHASSQADAAIDGIIREISRQALNPDFRVASALSLSGYAEDYIRAKFRAATGKTPVEFVNAIRVEHACMLMDIYGSELPVTRLAEKCGFSDPAYFSRVFKRIKAVSPRQYIRAHGR